MRYNSSADKHIYNWENPKEKRLKSLKTKVTFDSHCRMILQQDKNEKMAVLAVLQLICDSELESIAFYLWEMTKYTSMHACMQYSQTKKWRQVTDERNDSTD